MTREKLPSDDDVTLPFVVAVDWQSDKPKVETCKLCEWYEFENYALVRKVTSLESVLREERAEANRKLDAALAANAELESTIRARDGMVEQLQAKVATLLADKAALLAENLKLRAAKVIAEEDTGRMRAYAASRDLAARSLRAVDMKSVIPSPRKSLFARTLDIVRRG